MSGQRSTEIAPARVSRLLTAAEFHQLADVPPEVEWFANITNAHTRRAYENAVRGFMQFAGIRRPEEFRAVTRAHIIAWRDDLVHRGLGGSQHPVLRGDFGRKLAALGIHGAADLVATGGRRERHQPLPCSQQVPSFACFSRRND